MRFGLPKAYVVSTFTGEYKEHTAYCIRESSEKESILCLVFNPTPGVSIPHDMSTLVAVSPLRVCVEPSDAVLLDRNVRFNTHTKINKSLLIQRT